MSRAPAGKPRRKRRAPVRRAKKSASAKTATQIKLRTPTDEFVLDAAGIDGPKSSLASEAMRWSYTLRSRSRWADSQADEEATARAAADFLNRLGADAATLEKVAAAGSVEVDIPWSGREEDGWELRVLPWEYLIAGATRIFRAGRPVTVMRRLCVDRPAPPPFPKAPHVLFVASEPGLLRGKYKFDSERDLVRTNLDVDKAHWHELESPTSDELRSKVKEVRPDVVHLAGFDTHLARTILLANNELQAAAHLDDMLDEGRLVPGALSDGYVLAGRPVRGQELGKILGVDGHRPYLVGLNIGNSAARIAPLVVAEGAHAATGFQDNFDDDLAELFFSVLYARLKGGLGLAEAFTAAWQKVRSQPASSQGTGTVLWSADSLIRPAAAKQRMLADRIEKTEQTPVDPEDVGERDVRDYVSVKIEPTEDLNYSMLHNQRPLFKSFVLRSHKNRTLRNVRIKASLYSGSETAVYERTLDVLPPFVELKRFIHVPLTSLLTRSVHESVRTSLTVEVTWGNHLLYLDTSRVRLIPVDQWRDSDDDRKWLPSFVFPRDPAILRLVDCAQRYMRVLRDDPNCGFDGYQSVNVRQPKTLQQVDLQVQAIWSAIVYDLRLGYINPPPGYSRDLDSQRLRTPSMTVHDHSGTCIDLALFFAACLELIDVYPAIILLKDHAFPAYWRAESYHTGFKSAHPSDIGNIARADATVTTSANSQPDAWHLGAATYREIVDLVNDNKLVPIETVRLTENCGFWEAVGAGRDNLRDERGFDSMIDIALAREKQITPLPIMGEQS